MKKIIVICLLIVVSFIFSCTNIFGEYDNPVDPEADSYQGYRVEDVPVTGVEVVPTEIEIYPYEGAQQLSYSIEPSDSAHKEVVWSVNYPSIVSVSSSGLITPLGVGEAEVTVTTINGNKSDICYVTIKEYDEIDIDTTYDVTVVKSYWLQMDTIPGVTYVLSWADRQSGVDGCTAYIKIRPFADAFGKTPLWDDYYVANEGYIPEKTFTALSNTTCVNVRPFKDDSANSGDFLLAYWQYYEEY